MPFTEDVPVRRRVSRQALASAQRREQILDAAAAAFTEHGFNGASVRDIATRAGMSHTGVLHHFPDKTGLLEAVLDRRTARATQGLSFDPTVPQRFLCNLITLAERDVADPDGLRMYRVVAAEALSPAHPAHGYLQRWYARVRDQVTQALVALDQAGHYTGHGIPIPAAAAQIAGMRDGLDPQWLLDPDSIDLVDAVRAQLRLYTDVDL